MTLNEALILSYIKRGIGYGYNILSHVKESRSDEWVDFSRAGLYKTLDKLEKTGHVKQSLGQNGNRPTKKIYSISEQGEKALSTFLESGFDFDYQTKYNLDAYLVAAVAASPDASILLGMVNKRINAVEKHLETLANDWPEDKDSYPFIVYALFKRRLETLHHELEWLKWLENLLGKSSGDILHMTWDESKKS